MKKVGLCIQFEGVDNYGTILQAYATKYMVFNLGYQTKLIRYKRKYSMKYIVSQLPRMLDIRTYRGYKRNLDRKRNLKNSSSFKFSMSEKKRVFNDFRKKYFGEDEIDTYYGYEELSSNSVKYDAVLVGSDQLWLPEGLRTNFYNLMFVDDSVNKISYATSFGVSSIPNNQIKRTGEYLKRINSISVREESGSQIVRKISGKNAFVACDPVMLMDKNEWIKMIDSCEMPKGIEEDNYILCYFLGGNEEIRKEVSRISQIVDKKVVTIKFIEDYYVVDENFGDIAPTGIKPEQFMKLIKNASYIITDSFHGTAFSIIFGKKFVSVYRFSNTSKFSKNTRIENILERFELRDHLYIEGNLLDVLEQDIDYSKVNIKREEWRKKSLDFLQNALEEDKYVAKS